MVVRRAYTVENHWWISRHFTSDTKKWTYKTGKNIISAKKNHTFRSPSCCMSKSLFLVATAYTLLYFRIDSDM